jgi:hypothetical protein
MPAGTGTFSVARQEHRGDPAKMSDLNSGFDAARASGEMKVNDCQIGDSPILDDPHCPDGVGSGTDNGMAKLGQEHLQGEDDQMVILDDQNPHLVTIIR